MFAPVRHENVTELPINTCTIKAVLHADAIPVGRFDIGKATQTLSDSIINATSAAQSNSSKIKQVFGDILFKTAVAGSKKPSLFNKTERDGTLADDIPSNSV